jgi:hypothetical protein
MTDQRPLKRDKISELVNQYRRQYLEDIEWHIGSIRTPRQLEASRAGIQVGYDFANEALINFNYSNIAPTAKKILAGSGYLVDEKSANFGLFCRGLLSVQKELSAIQQDIPELVVGGSCKSCYRLVTSRPCQGMRQGTAIPLRPSW